MTKELPIIQDAKTVFTDFIQLTMIDGMRKEKSAMVFFNAADGWGQFKGIENNEVPVMFAGHVIEMFKKDASCFAYKATAYKINGSTVKKTFTFTPMIKLDDEFKPCHIHEDGTVTMVD